MNNSQIHAELVRFTLDHAHVSPDAPDEMADLFGEVPDEHRPQLERLLGALMAHDGYRLAHHRATDPEFREAMDHAVMARVATK